MDKLLIAIGSISEKISIQLNKYFSKVISIENHLGTFNSLEEAENNASTLDFLALFSKPETYKNIIVIIDGGENVSGCCLTILEYFKEQNVQIVYIKPDLEYAEDETKLNHEMVNQILQEKTRSGNFDRLYLIDVPIVDEYISRLEMNISISNYYDKLAEFISSVFYNILWISNEKPIFGKIKVSKEINRISTIGVVDIMNNKIFPFYKLEMVREREYYVLLSKEEVIKNNGILKEIRKHVSTLTSNQNHDSVGASTSFGIYETDHSHSQYYCKLNTNLVQESQYLTEFKRK